MGVGTSIKYIESGDNSKVPPGYFWCEVLLGKQYSATYEFMHGGIHDSKPYWKPISCWEADLAPNSHTKYVMWRRSTYFPEVPRLFNVLSDVKRINVEFKGNCPFEVHLRDTPDPDYDVLIPIWKDTSIADIEWYLKQGYTYVSDPDDSNGFLELPREGFMVK